MALNIFAHNAAFPVDVDNDNWSTPTDALVIVNYLNEVQSGVADAGLIVGEGEFSPSMDVNDDGSVSAIDALRVINYLNDPVGEGETIKFRFEATDLTGTTPLTSISVGNPFLLKVYVQDVRQDATGAFSAYLDTVFPSDLLEFDYREKQTIAFTGNPTSGNYRLSFKGEQTANIAFNHSAANAAGSNATNAQRIQEALDSLPGIEPGDVVVQPTPLANRSFDVFFGGKFANLGQPEIVGTNVSLNGTNPTITVTESSGVDSAVAANSFGSIAFAVPTYENGRSGSLKTRTDSGTTLSEIDDVGGFTASFSPLGGEEFLLYSVQLHAKAAGQAVITGDNADVSPQHDVTLYGLRTAVCPSVNTCVGSLGFVPTTVTVLEGGVQLVNDEVTVAEDSGATPINVLGNDTAVTGGALAITSVTQGANGQVVNNGTNVTYRPADNFFGTDTFTYTAGNTEGSKTATVTVTVTGVNDAPTAGNDGPNAFFSTKQNVSKTVSFGEFQTQVLANDSPGPLESSQTLTVTGPFDQSGEQTGSQGGKLKYTDLGATGPSPDDSLTYTPANNFRGNETFVYDIVDNGTPALSARGTVTVNVSPVNQPPVATDKSQTTAENTQLPIQAATLLQGNNAGAGDTDQTISLSAVAAIPGVTKGTVTLNGNVVTYVPLANTSGTDVFTYTIVDSHPEPLTATANVTVTITAVNDPPDAVNDNLDIDEFTTNNTLDVLANDSPGPLETDPLTITNVTTPSRGSAVSIAPDGKSLRYTPNASIDSPYTESFSYTISDGSLTDTATVTIDVVPVVRPRARRDDLEIAEDAAPVTKDVLTNDLGNAGFPLRITRIVSGPSHGTATIDGMGTSDTADDGIRYDSEDNYNGTDFLVYEIDDDFAGSVPSTATLAITISARNDAPIQTVPGAQTTAEDTALSFGPIQVQDVDAGNGDVRVTLQVDSGRLQVPTTLGADVTGNNSASVTLVGTVAEINATLGGQSITFTPASNASGNVQLVVTTNDQGNTGASGALEVSNTLAITVNAVNDAPTVNAPGTLTAFKNQPLPIVNAIQVADLDAGNANVSVELKVTKGKLAVGSQANVTVTGNNSATVQLSGSVANISALLAGTVTYTPNADVTGSDSLTVTIDDLGATGSGGAKTATATSNIAIQDFLASKIGGVVYLDRDNDGVMESDDQGLAGVQVKLLGTATGNVAVDMTTTTDSHGRFTFAEVKPGSYRIVQTEQPAHTVDGHDQPGAFASSTVNDEFQIEVRNPGGITATDNYFAEAGLGATYAGLGVWDILASGAGPFTDGVNVGSTGNETWYAMKGDWDGFSNARVAFSANMQSVTLTVFDEVAKIDRSVTISVDSAAVRYRKFGADYVVRIVGKASEFFGPINNGSGEGEDAATSAAEALVASSNSTTSTAAVDQVLGSLFARSRR